MLEAIKELGAYIKKKEKLNEVEMFVDKAKLDRKTKKILCIIFEHNDNRYYFKKVIPEDYDHKKASLCLYRGTPGSGPDLLPSTIITDINKSFEKRIMGWFKGSSESELIEIGKFLEKEKDKIKKQIAKEYNGLKKEDKNNVLLTIKIEENGEEMYLGKIDIFKNILIKEAVKRYFFVNSIGESKGNGICLLCENHKVVYGFVLPAFGFSFATADKSGFAPSLVKINHWKNVPICKDCGISSEIGKRFLDNLLSFNFFGYKYYIIPQFIFGKLFDEFYETITYYKDKEYVEGLLSEEDYLEEIVKEKQDILRLIFLFYKQKGGGKYIDIMRYVEDVLPSWLKEMYNCQNSVKMMSLFQEENIKKILGKNWVGDFVKGRIGQEKGLGRNNWFIKFTRDFFPSSKTQGVYNKYFLDVVSSILSKKPIDKNFMTSAFVRVIRSAIKKKNSYGAKILCLKAFMLNLFLSKIDLLGGEKMEEKMVEKNGGKNIQSRVDHFFKEYGFVQPPKKAVFSVGMLIDYLLWIQRNERGAGFGEEPFWSNLYGLVLDEKKVKRLFPKALGKLRQYRRGFPTLEAIVGKYLADAEQGWDISNDEISYYFVLGMTLRKSFTEEKQ